MRYSLRIVIGTVALAASSMPAALLAADEALAITAARIYASPTEAPIENGAVLVRDGKIVAIGPRTETAIPETASQTTACAGGVIVAGFQNSHVHFTEPQFSDAATQPAEPLADHLTRMLTRYGFTTVVDTGSMLDNTLALRARIERGEIPGPRVLTAGIPIYPADGIPFYLRDLPPEVLERLAEPTTVEEALAVVRANLDRGADATKLFVATPQGKGKVTYMSHDIARAAAQESHARGRLVFAHPTDNEGVRIALDADVDVLVHTTFEDGPSIWPPEQVAALVAHRMAVVPTLKLWPYELKKVQLAPNIVDLALNDAVAQVRAFAAAGGQVLFGTDVGYMTDYDPTDEYVYLSRALTPMQVLDSLTAAPAARWKESDRRGGIAPGMDADLVVLNGDPARDVRRFADVRCTFRNGRLIYSQPVAARVYR